MNSENKQNINKQLKQLSAAKEVAKSGDKDSVEKALKQNGSNSYRFE